MKKLLIIPMLFASCIAIGRAKTDYNKPTLNKNTLQRLLDTANIIGKPIKFGNLDVAQYNFPHKMNWDAAKKACRALGKGWRLPTKQELNLLYQNMNAIGGFASNYYWSSTEDEDNNFNAWCQRFDNGDQDVTSTSFSTIYVRAIRDF